MRGRKQIDEMIEKPRTWRRAREHIKGSEWYIELNEERERRKEDVSNKTVTGKMDVSENDKRER